MRTLLSIVRQGQSRLSTVLYRQYCAIVNCEAPCVSREQDNDTVVHIPFRNKPLHHRYCIFKVTTVLQVDLYYVQFQATKKR